MLTAKDCYVKETCKKYSNGTCQACSDEFCIRLFKLNQLYEQSLLTDFQRQHKTLRLDADMKDLNAFNRLKEIQTKIKKFVDTGGNIYIHSANVGNGKTSWAIRLLQSYFTAIWPDSGIQCRGLFINVPKFFLSLKDSISNQNTYIDHIKQHVLLADLVIWDEVGTKGLTQFEHENLLSLINSRIDLQKSNIYTSNLTPSELREKVGDRLYSRIVNNSEDIELFGVDKRGVTE